MASAENSEAASSPTAASNASSAPATTGQRSLPQGSVVVAQPVHPVATVAELVGGGVAERRVGAVHLAGAGRQRRQVFGAGQRARVAGTQAGRLRRRDRAGGRRVFERLELAFDKAAQAGAVVAFEGPQRLDGALQLLPAASDLLGDLGDLHPRLLLGDAGARLGRLDALLVAGLQALGQLTGASLGCLGDLAGTHLRGLGQLAG